MAGQVSIVTPEGVRDGDPAALSGLTERRGAAVLAYAEHVAGPGRSVQAAADAFAWFRAAVVAAADPYAVDPERTLLRGTRLCCAAAAPPTVALRVRLRGGAGPCALVPELLAARAEGDLGAADLGRLDRHLSRCAPCRAAEQRFRAGERAYRDAPDTPPSADAARAIVQALVAAGPRRPAEPRPPAEPAPAPLHPHAPDVEPQLEETGDEPVVPWTAPVEPAAYAPDPAPVVAAAFDLADPTLAPVAHTADAHQPTYEFDALPYDAFDVSPDGAAAAGPPGGSAALRIVLPLLIVLAALVAVLAIAGVFRA